MPSKQTSSKAQPSQNNNNNSNSNNSNNTDTTSHLKDTKYWILEWAATHYLPHFIQALSEDESEGFKQFLASTDENVRNRVLLCLVPSMAGSSRTDETLTAAINAFRGSAPATHEKYPDMMTNLKLYILIDELEAREITRKGDALKLWKQIYEPADTDKDRTLNNLIVKELNQFDATSRKRIIDRFIEDYGLRHFIDRLEEFVKDVLISEFDTPILDQISKDVRKGDYFPIGTVIASELRAAFEGTDQQWQNIFQQKDKHVKEYVKKLQQPRQRPVVVSPDEPVPQPQPAAVTPHTTPKNLQAQKFSKSAAVSGQQRPLAIKLNNQPIQVSEEPAQAPIVQPKPKQGKPRLDKQVSDKIKTLRDESSKLLAHGEDPLPKALQETDAVKKPKRHSMAPTTSARQRSRSPSPRPSPRPSPSFSQGSQPSSKSQDSGKPKSAPSSTTKGQAAEPKQQPKRKRSAGQGTLVEWESDEDFAPDEADEEEPIVLRSPQTLKEFNVISQQKRGVKKTGQRKRRRWTDQETLTLIRGIMEFGLGSWSTICKAFEFEDRTPVDLKDRYRTITSSDDKLAQFNTIVERLKNEKLEKRMKQKQQQQMKNNNNQHEDEEEEDVDVEHYDEEEEGQEEPVDDIEEDEEEEQSLQIKKKKKTSS